MNLNSNTKVQLDGMNSPRNLFNSETGDETKEQSNFPADR